MLKRAMVPVRVTVVMLAALALLLVPGMADARPKPADTVLVNGAILGFHGLVTRGGRGWPAGGSGDYGSRGRSEETHPDSSEPEFAEALAIQDGRIIFIGSSKKARSYAGAATKVIDLDGRMVMPGIVDGHFHGTRPTDCSMEYE